MSHRYAYIILPSGYRRGMVIKATTRLHRSLVSALELADGQRARNVRLRKMGRYYADIWRVCVLGPAKGGSAVELVELAKTVKRAEPKPVK